MKANLILVCLLSLFLVCSCSVLETIFPEYSLATDEPVLAEDGSEDSFDSNSGSDSSGRVTMGYGSGSAFTSSQASSEDEQSYNSENQEDEDFVAQPGSSSEGSVLEGVDMTDASVTDLANVEEQPDYSNISAIATELVYRDMSDKTEDIKVPSTQTMASGLYYNQMPFYLAYDGGWQLYYNEMNNNNGQFQVSSGYSAVSFSYDSTIRGYAYDGYAENSRGEIFVFPSPEGRQYATMSDEEIMELRSFLVDSESVDFHLANTQRPSTGFSLGDGSVEPVLIMSGDMANAAVSFIDGIFAEENEL